MVLPYQIFHLSEINQEEALENNQQVNLAACVAQPKRGLRSQWLSSPTMPECFLQAKLRAFSRQSRRNFRAKPKLGK